MIGFEKRPDEAWGKTHTLVETFSSESGVSMAKAMRITWDLEYDNGRKR
jgi:hypothetical protein